MYYYLPPCYHFSSFPEAAETAIPHFPTTMLPNPIVTQNSPVALEAGSAASPQLPRSTFQAPSVCFGASHPAFRLPEAVAALSEPIPQLPKQYVPGTVLNHHAVHGGAPLPWIPPHGVKTPFTMPLLAPPIGKLLPSATSTTAKMHQKHAPPGAACSHFPSTTASSCGPSLLGAFAPFPQQSSTVPFTPCPIKTPATGSKPAPGAGCEGSRAGRW